MQNIASHNPTFTNGLDIWPLTITRGPKGNNHVPEYLNLEWNDQPKKHKLAWGHCNLASCQILLSSVQMFSCCTDKIEIVSVNQRRWRPSCISDRPRKTQTSRGHWDLAACKVSFYSVQRLQRISRNCLSLSEARTAILVFRSTRKHKRGRGC